MPSHIVDQIMALPNHAWTKGSSGAYRKCSAIHFGLPSQRFPNMRFRGSTHHKDLEAEIVSLFATTGTAFTNIIINKYVPGCSMDRHNDHDLPDFPMQVACIVGEFTGGSLHFFTPQGTQSVYGVGNYMINGNIDHEVSVVESGVRYSIISYCKNLTTKTNPDRVAELRSLGYPIPDLEDTLQNLNKSRKSNQHQY